MAPRTVGAALGDNVEVGLVVVGLRVGAAVDVRTFLIASLE